VSGDGDNMSNNNTVSDEW